MAERRKRGGHLISKHRFIAAQFEAFLDGDCWLDLARHANGMADRLARELAAIGLRPYWPVEANLLFVLLPQRVHDNLAKAGAHYYAMGTHHTHPAMVPPQQILARLVTSFATTAADIEKFIATAKQAQ